MVSDLKKKSTFNTLILIHIVANIPKAFKISQRTPPPNNANPLTPENRRDNNTMNPNAIQITRILLYKVMYKLNLKSFVKTCIAVT